MAEEFVRALSTKVGKVVRDREGGYTLVIADVGGVHVLFCFKEGATGYYQVKVILEEDLSTLSCREAEYSPRGLYAFSREPSELADRSYEKALALIGKKRLPAANSA